MREHVILRTGNLKKYYGKGETQVHALDGVNLEIEAGKFVAIIGTSGSGKSTLLNLLGGLDTPTSGTVTIGNTELSGLKEEQLTVFRRRRIGFIFQNYNLIPTLNVWKTLFSLLQWMGRNRIKNLLRKLSDCLDWNRKSTVCRTVFPAASSSVWRLPAPLPPNRILYWQTNRPEIWTPGPAIMWSSCCV